MLYLSEAETSALADEGLALEAAREAFTTTGRVFPVVVAQGHGEGEQFTLKSASAPSAAGVKIGSYWPGNDQLGLPRHASTIVLLDPRTGVLCAVVEAAAGNSLRTAAADALATDTLARPDSTTLAILGTGHQAFFEAAAVVRVRPITRVLVAGRRAAKAESLASRLGDQLHLPCQAVGVREAVETADVIATATTSRSPLFDARWVRPGTHISAMGADSPGKQELPVELLARASLFCDLEGQSRSIGEFQHVGADARLTELRAVLSGTAPARTSPKEITVFDSSGFAVQDLAFARALIDAHVKEATTS